MSAPRLRVGGFDFSPYLRTQPDESPAADPSGAGYFRPQFSGAAALSEGSSWVSDAVDNRTMVFPLYFTALSRAEIQKLIQEADMALVKGAQVEFAIDPEVDPSSFFDLERGVLAEEFNFYHLINGVAGAVLTLTVRPYANTGTHRLVASIPAATSAVVEFAASGILGDAYALANLEVRVGSAIASAGRVVAWGVHPHPSHNPYRQATSGLAQTGATVRGASGAIGSQYTAIPVSPTGASGIAYTAFLDPVSAHVGRHRVIAIGRSGLTVPVTLWAEDRFGAVLGATAQATQIDQTKWQLVDLGEVNVPARASGQETVPTQFVSLHAGGATGGAPVASGGFHLVGLLFLPLDYSAGILRTAGNAGGKLAYDTRNMAKVLSGPAFLDSVPLSDSGYSWSRAGGYLMADYNYGGYFGVVVNSAGSVFTGATAFYDLASGAAFQDVSLEMETRQTGEFGNGASGASGAWFEAWAKRNPAGASIGVWARITRGPSACAAIYTGHAGAATMLASVAIASSLGTALNQKNTVTALTAVGATAQLYMKERGLAGGAALLTVGHGDISAVGNPAVGFGDGAATKLQTGEILGQYLNNPFVLYSAGGGASDISAREWFRFESHPEGRVYQGNASVFTADRLAAYRGQFPKMPPIGSGAAATGPARVVVLQGEVDNIQGLDGPDIALTVLERFRFLR